ncbi:RNA-directed DNA polymerase from mobile element jockey [Eumeta japonica]|uniref:RNA-directed DNA polymerase from mobile element jockey n=1 Tax=Eumeta variegata TaxID=151549 RepID=A0A4C1WAD9_EUMVA|nr:RNA-directed DNA polymerase from mobile element jockey [Eumeta japonica]
MNRKRALRTPNSHAVGTPTCRPAASGEEAPYRKGMPGQCHRCQLYGHAALNCHAQPRCVKCPVPHWTKECNRTKDAGDEPSCCNYSQKHTANYGGCPRAPKPRPIKRTVIKRTDSSKQPTDTTKARQPTNIINKANIGKNKSAGGDAEFIPPLKSTHGKGSNKRSAGAEASALGEDISTIMSILQVVRSAEVSDLAVKFRKAKHGVDRLKILLDNQDLINSTAELSKCALEYKADIIMVQKAHLKPHFPKSCKISNIILLRTDRQGASKGGTAIYYNRALYCCPIDIPQLINIEASACKLSMTGHSILILVSIYLPPKKELLRSDLEALFALGDAVILVGDFNSKNSNWKCNYTNRNGREMEAFAESLHFEIVTPLTPTHYPNNINHRPDILDIALMKGVALKLSCIEPLQWLNSDHRPVLMRLGSLIADRQWSKTALGQFRRTQIKELPRCQELIRDKNAALRRAGKYPTCENRSRARALQRKVKARMKEVRNENSSDLMSEISPSHKAYWGLAKALKTEGAVPTPALKKPDKSIAFNDREKAECLADSIEHQCSENSPYDLEHVRRVEEEVFQNRGNHATSPLVIAPPNHSCPQQALRLVEHISEGFKVKRKTVAVFFDVAKAFDRVWHAGAQLALFADDTALYIRSNSIENILTRLQRAIDELTQWLRLWRIDINPDKSASIYFNYSAHKVQLPVPFDTPHLKILGKPIPWQHNYKYLGITIDKHLHFRDHIARVRKLATFYYPIRHDR